MNDPAIEAEGLTRTFPGGVVAVNELDLEVRRGVLYGLMGRNGAGKTTLLRLLLGLLHADRGTARLLGCDFRHAPRELRRRVAYVPQAQQLPGAMSLEELARWLRHLNPGWDAVQGRRLADSWGVPWRKPVASMSSGDQRKAAILVAFAGRPEVLLLDEPAAGFDLVARRALVDLIVDRITQSDGCAVLFSTHILADLERVADHIGVLSGGRMALSARLEDLLSTMKRVQLIFEEDPPPDLVIPGAIRTHRSGTVVSAIVRWAHGGELELLRRCVDARVQVFPLGLEEMFLELFGNGKCEPLEIVSPPQGGERKEVI